MSATPEKIEDSFIDNDTAKYIEMPVSFFYEQIKFKEYNYRRNFEDTTTFTNMPYKICKTRQMLLENVTVIVAEMPREQIRNRYIIKYKQKIIRAKDLFMLVSLLNLHQQLSSELFDEFSDIETLLMLDINITSENIRAIFRNLKSSDNEPNISDKDLELIKAWCSQYGYPFSMNAKEYIIISENNKRTETITDDGDSKTISFDLGNHLVPPYREVSFWVWEFLRKLQILYTGFLLYSRVCNKDLEYLGITNISVKKYTIEECEKLLQQIYKTVNLKGILDFEQYKKHNEGLLIGYETDSVFDLAIYSLFVFMSNFEQNLRRCPLCLNFFRPKTGRQKYCDSKGCYPQLAYKRKKSQQKKHNKN